MATEVFASGAVRFEQVADCGDEAGVLAGAGGDVDVVVGLCPGEGVGRRVENGRGCGG